MSAYSPWPNGLLVDVHLEIHAEDELRRNGQVKELGEGSVRRCIECATLV